VARTRHKISQSGHDYFLLSLQTSGQGVIEQDGRTAILRVGDSRYTIRLGLMTCGSRIASANSSCGLPRRMVGERVFDAEQFTALRIDGSTGAGRVASVFFQQLHSELDHVAGTSVDNFMRAEWTCLRPRSQSNGRARVIERAASGADAPYLCLHRSSPGGGRAQL